MPSRGMCAELFAGEETSRDHRRPGAGLPRSWDLHVDFGLTHPDSYILAYVQPRPGRMPALDRESLEILHGLIARIGERPASDERQACR